MIRTLLTSSAIALILSTAAIAQTETPADPAAPAPETTQVDPAAPADPAAPVDPATPADPAAPADSTVTTDPAPATELDTGAAETTEIDEPWDISQGYVAADSDNLVTQILGSPVYSSTADDAEQIGTVNDIVLNADGSIAAVILGVGGFLGIGEKSVAVDFRSFEFALAADNTERWVLATTAEALTAAPDFVWQEDEPIDPVTDPALDPMAPVDPAVPAVPQ